MQTEYIKLFYERGLDLYVWKWRGHSAMKVQVVEDDLSLNRGIVLALKEDGFSFVQCNTVRQARASYEAGRPAGSYYFRY